MYPVFILIYLALIGTISTNNSIDRGRLISEKDVRKVEYQYEIEKWLNKIDSDLSHLNTLAAYITWNSSTNPDEKIKKQAKELVIVRNRWKNKVCKSKINNKWATKEQQRKIYLLCRGPKFTDEAAIQHIDTIAAMSLEYNSEICLNDNPILINKWNASNFPKPGDCLYGEPDLERLLKRVDLSADQLEWLWTSWHDFVGPKIKKIYRESIGIQNQAARNNGYHDIGEAWREELEIPNLEQFVFDLYKELQPLYVLLHAVIRYKLYEKYGSNIIDPTGPIPEHLLGNMWGQDWSSLIDLFNLTSARIDLNAKLKEKQRSVRDMVLEAEDFYMSLGFPKMTAKFWQYSILEENPNITLCHGTAANLYNKDDYRMLMCGKTTMDDFYVIHHEMGHIEYYMAASQQPAIFQDGTNTAFHESIGDAIMHGAMTPQHLYRLGLLTDEQLSDKNIELYLLFQQALSKIPEIPYSLIIDKYRWELFRNNIPYEQWNEYFWYLNRKYRGIVPPKYNRDKDGFDAGAKFHIPDNTPYIRYFLSSIIQMQIFKSLCEVSLYEDALNTDTYLPLYRCDIYGSKDSGKKLWEMMEKGSSIHWTEAMLMINETDLISTEALLQYYRPVYEWLQKYIELNNIYVGW